MPLIDHVGILVENLEEAIERWSRVIGYHFSPIARYRTHSYSDNSNPELHFHDARISFSREGPPYIELMEATGDGTHGMSQLGIHHFGFQGIADPQACMNRFSMLGIDADGKSFNDDGQLTLSFTVKSAMDGIRIEVISPLPGPLVADDGSELWKDPDTGRISLWGSPEST